MTDKPSFTEYRASGSTGAGSAGGHQDSPFSSPASRFEDDFAGPSSVGSYGSSGTGTLSAATGIPNRKRQRANDGRGHASTASLSSLSGALNTTARRNRMSSGSGSHHSSAGNSNRHSLGGDGFDRSRIPGLADTMADDWTLGNESPQNPPSGSFGPAIGDLSLGAGAGSDDLLPSLFPELQPRRRSDGAANYSTGYPESSPTDSRRSSDAAHRMLDNTSTGSLFADQPLPMQTDPTPAQEELARQQVRQDLVGVDQRALRGPLRALVQEVQQQYQPQGDGSNLPTPTERISQAQMDSALRAAVESFMAETEAKTNNASGFPNFPSNAFNANSMPMAKSSTSVGLGGMTQAQRNLLFPGANSASQQQQQPQPGNPFNFGGQGPPPSGRPSVGPRRRSNSFDVSYLPASRPWFSQSPPQQDRSNATPSGMQPPQGAQSGNSVGQGTGWVTLPTNTFNAFDLSGLGANQAISAAQQNQGKPQRRTLNRDRSGLTVNPEETFLNGLGQGGNNLDSALRGWQGGDLSGGAGPMVGGGGGGGGGGAGGSSSGAGNFGSTVPSKPQLTRGDTAKPSLQQLLQQQQQQTLAQLPSSMQPPPSQLPRPLTADSSQGSGISLFSPASSETTPSTEDEDEKPYHVTSLPSSQPGAGLNIDAFLKQQQAAGGTGNWPFASGSRPGNMNLQQPNAYAHPPRFMASSSSSSESEDDTAPMQSAALRGFGPFFSSGVGLGPNPNALASIPGSQTVVPGLSEAQPLARGRGLQGGYGYMPGSADSGLRLDTSANTTMGNGLGGQGYNDVNGPPSSQLSQDGSMMNGGGTGGGGSSPSIRSTAQNAQPPGFLDNQQRNRGQPSGNKAAYGGYPLPTTVESNPASRRSSIASSSGTSGQSIEEQDESPDAAAADSEEDEEDYLDDGQQKKKKTAAATRRKNAATGSTRKARTTTTTTGTSPTKRSTGDSSSNPAMYGHQLPTGPGGVSHHGGLTICEYISPFSGIRCGTEFHRPYDLARHRETIHAKEEASLMRQGKLKREQCRVLYVEVDPETSAATKEWKCDSCGRTFSRRDALLRHERLRAH